MTLEAVRRVGGGHRVKRCIIIGQPNVGKTMFALHFAQYLGMAKARIAFAEAGGRRWEAAYPWPRRADDPDERRSRTIRGSFSR